MFCAILLHFAEKGCCCCFLAPCEKDEFEALASGVEVGAKLSYNHCTFRPHKYSYTSSSSFFFSFFLVINGFFFL